MLTDMVLNIVYIITISLLNCTVENKPHPTTSTVSKKTVEKLEEKEKKSVTKTSKSKMNSEVANKVLKKKYGK